MTMTRDIVCPTCDAKPGEPCSGVWFNASRGRPVGFHDARRRAARKASSATPKPA